MNIETVAIRIGFAPAIAQGIEQACERFGIDTELRACHFLAQVAHESGCGRWLKEIWGPTRAQSRYEGREDLGNTQPGDGSRFRGRGLIQITGRANYAEYSQDLYGDDRCVRDPAMLEVAPDAALCAGWFWHSRNLNTLADQDQVVAVTKRINGGTNGLADRVKWLDKAKAAFLEVNPDFSNVQGGSDTVPGR